jgi:2-hydroxy-6-oxonona-2,4-dienedioate hydrolase
MAVRSGAQFVVIRRAIYSRPGFAESMRHILCLQDPQVGRRNMVTDAELAAVPGPTLVIWTSEDPSGPAGAGVNMAERIPNGRLELINGAGHRPRWEQRETCNRGVVDVLTED